ncbi:hypothetical protein JCGZ_19353 [Jatropha curcas]|uniref:Uncharacterized protein n=1 Tax=Jatropha curcas TaxID=180498 RepID=A0A067K0B5_JATCU|nr:hypothetical protein JCGZ_19353 [Jatropha curcas]
MSRNRLSETGDEGAGPSQHIDDSISEAEITKKLAKKFNRQPTLMDVLTFTYTKDHDGTQTGEQPTINELQLYLEVVGGEKKRKVYGIGLQSDIFYNRTHGVSASTEPHQLSRRHVSRRFRIYGLSFKRNSSKYHNLYCSSSSS